MCGWFDLEPLFLGRLRPERLTSNQIASQHRKKLRLEAQAAHLFLLGPNGRGPLTQTDVSSQRMRLEASNVGFVSNCTICLGKIKVHS